MKNWTLLVGGVLVVCGVGAYLLASVETDNPTILGLQDRIAHLPILPTSANTLSDGIVSGNGRIEAVQVDVTTKIAGRVSEIMVQEGDLVDVGQPIAVIDTAQLQAQLLGAQADIASAQSQVAAAEASVSQAQAQLVLAEQEMSRVSALVERQVASQETYDISVSERDVARANVVAAKANLVSQHRGVDAARAFAQEIETQIDDSILTASAVGRVLYRLAEPGEVLASGGKVVTLVNLNDVYMEIFLPSSQAFRVAVGSEARIKLDITEFAIPATVSFVSPESQFTPKQVETSEERDKLVFRVKVRAASELVQNYIEQIKTGVRGVAYVRLSGEGPLPDWPEHLQNLVPVMPASASN
ncbi:HlyD family secretion protein [Tateyamaria sp. SN3-11]|uniref:HlyD family secretion protein n=1 Tax=Tateyamaria sp. SN3-11 TaxID=3092147 RepID=UPI0039EB8A92